MIDSGTLTEAAIDTGGETALATGEVQAADSVPNTTATTFNLTVGDTATGFVNTPTDQDWFRISLVAGQTYNFALNKTSGDLDCWVEVHDASGALLAQDDDGGPGLNSLLSFLCTETGTYYISAQAYHDATQSSSGGYELTTSIGTAPRILDSIDWGTQIANPTNITVYFAAAGETFAGFTSQGWNAYQQQQAMAALQTWANVANLNFSVTNVSAGATLHLVTATSNSFLGEMIPPGGTDQGVGIFATNGSGWATGPGGGLEPGGQGWATLIHEFGHALGLAHPHDNGGTSSVMQRVTASFSSYGLYDLNQGVFTTMSYNRGWATGPNGVIVSNQFIQATPMALDVALVQQKYGANTTYHSGNDTYQLPVSNSITTDYLCIWDTGGTDTIAYGGSASCTIDLHAATIDYTATGGGLVSLVSGVYGGFTIAKGAVVENATGGLGADTLIGNSVDNVLDGGDGNDTFKLQDGGNDTALGGAGDDTFYFGAAFNAADHVDGGGGTNDQIGLEGDYSAGLTLAANTITGVEVIAALPGYSYNLTTADGNVPAGVELTIFAGGLGASDHMVFNGAAETDGNFRTFGGAGSDSYTGGAKNDGFYFGPGHFDSQDFVNGGAGTNDQLGLDGDYTLTLGTNITNVEVVVMIQKPGGSLNTYNLSTVDAFVAAGQTMTIYGVQVVNPITFNGSAETNGAFRVFGGLGADIITTGAGNDSILGGAGADILTGGGGADTFIYNAASESTGAGFDTLLGFDFAVDRIDLPNTVDAYQTLLTGRLDAATFDANLTAVMGGLTAGTAILFTPNSGSYAGQHFVIVDGNGVAGYQAGADYVFKMDVAAPVGPPPDFII